MNILKPICFNGKYHITPTSAVIFREADEETPTMFLDEFENGGAKNIGNLMDILNSGFQKGATVKRIAAASKGGSVEYDVYCPKMFACINSMNIVLQSRSIHIKMLRKLPDEKTKDILMIHLQQIFRKK